MRGATVAVGLRAACPNRFGFQKRFKDKAASEKPVEIPGHGPAPVYDGDATPAHLLRPNFKVAVKRRTSLGEGERGPLRVRLTCGRESIEIGDEDNAARPNDARVKLERALDLSR